jgi:hypothetical protein
MLKFLNVIFLTLFFSQTVFGQEDPWASIEGFDDELKNSVDLEISSSSMLLSSSSEKEPKSSKEQAMSSESLKPLSLSVMPSSSISISSSFEKHLSSNVLMGSSAEEKIKISSSNEVSSSSQKRNVFSSSKAVVKQVKKKPKFKIIVETEEEDDSEAIVFENGPLFAQGGPTKLQVKTRSGIGNSNNYRSPKAAFFTSLVLPGAGQAYVASAQGGWLRASAWFVTEAALWVGLNSLGWEAEKKALNDQNNAFEHWNMQKFESALYDSLKAHEGVGAENFKQDNLSTRYDYCRSIHKADDQSSACETFSQHGLAGSYISSISHSGFEINERARLYRIVTFREYDLGWNNLDHKTQLAEAIDDEEIARDRVTWFITGIVFNHVLSAIDAACMAHSGNKDLYSSKKRPKMSGLQGYLAPDRTGELSWRLSLVGEF